MPTPERRPLDAERAQAHAAEALDALHQSPTATADQQRDAATTSVATTSSAGILGCTLIGLAVYVVFRGVELANATVVLVG